MQHFSHMIGGVLLLFVLSHFPFVCPQESGLNTYYPSAAWSDPFDWKLLKAVVRTYSHNNVIISPVSLKILLAILYEGAGGLTEKEFSNSQIQFPEHKEVLRKKFARLLLTLFQTSESKEYVLKWGTRLFLDSSIQPQQAFAAKALTYYKASIEATNFSIPNNAAITINSWIDKLTDGRVSKMVTEDSLKGAAFLVANALYFKGSWIHPFSRNATEVRGFYVTPEQFVSVPFMITTGRFYFYNSYELDAKILRMTYKGSPYAFFMVLPNSKGGLSQLVQHASVSFIHQQLYRMEESVVEVVIPKFQFSTEVQFTEILKEFGLVVMFSRLASFPGIARGKHQANSSNALPLSVSQIIQKSGIEIDEEGSVAFSSTDVTISNKFGAADNVFNATHPFLFFVEEQTQGTILFVGQVTNPLITQTANTNSPSPSSVAVTDYMGTVGQDVPDLDPEDPERLAIKQRFNYFDLELLREFNDVQGNVFISPASIKSTLAMILEGANGKSASEIGNALRIDDINNPQIREILEKVLFDLNDHNSNQSATLWSSNGVFVSDQFKISPSYRDKLLNDYGALVKELNFHNPSAAARAINTWARNGTHNLIPEIVTEDSVDVDTVALLANVLYFKSNWKISFDEKSTTTKCFFVQPNKCVQARTMLIASTFRYAFVVPLNAHVVELLYENDKYAMLLVIPTDTNNVRILTRDLQHIPFSSILSTLTSQEVILEMPSFDIEYTSELSEVLKRLHINDVFTTSASLTGIVPKANIRVSHILHKTKISVDEHGTTAAAASAAMIIPLIGNSDIRLVVNRPFVFFIYQRQSHNIIFEGIINDPTLSV